MKKTEPVNVTVRVRVGDSEVQITGPSDYVDKKVAEFLERASNTFVKTQVKNPAFPPPDPTTKLISAAQFFRLCNPQSDNDRTLVAAYFLEKYKSFASFTAGEIRETIREAKVPPPSNTNDAVNQNIRKGFLMATENKGNKMAFVVTSDGEASVEKMQKKG